MNQVCVRISGAWHVSARRNTMAKRKTPTKTITHTSTYNAVRATASSKIPPGRYVRAFLSRNL